MSNPKAPSGYTWRLISNLAMPVGCGLLFLFLLQFVFFIGYVPTASMEPTVRSGSFVFGIRFHGIPQHGDVVVFRHDGQLLVKRIAGAEGDVVYTDTGELLAVPEHSYYMLGDNQGTSNDSRYWKEPFVEDKDIVAIVPLCSYSNVNHPSITWPDGPRTPRSWLSPPEW